MNAGSWPAEPRALKWIAWRDAVNESARVHPEALEGLQLAVNRNVGWVVHEDAARLVLAHGYSTSGELDVFVIPVNAILHRQSISDLFPEAPREYRHVHKGQEAPLSYDTP